MIETSNANYFPPMSLGAVVAGAVVGLVINLALFLLGFGIFFVIFEFEFGESLGPGTAVATGLYLSLATFFACLAGGYVTAHFSPRKHPRDSGLRGLSSFALAAVVLAFFFSSTAMTGLGALITKAGTGMSAGIGASAVAEQLADLRIVTDLSILKGKAVTQFVPSKSARGHELEQALKSAGAQVEHAAADPETKGDLKKAATDIRKASAIVTLGSFALLLLGAFGSYWGGIMALTRGRIENDEIVAEKNKISNAA